MQELRSKINVTADHYNIYYRGGTGSDNTTVTQENSYLGMKERLTTVAQLINKYNSYVDEVAAGTKIINPNWLEAYNDGEVNWYDLVPENIAYNSNETYYLKNEDEQTGAISYEVVTFAQLGQKIWNQFINDTNITIYKDNTAINKA